MHDHDRILRDAYAAFGRGDLAGFLASCTDDIHFIVPGSNRLAGTYSREQFGPGLISAVMEMTAGSFREIVLDVFVSDRGGVVYVEHSFRRGSTPHTYRSMHLYDIVGGQLASFREVPLDLPAFDAAWA